jgi:hypothetical protein
MRQKCTPRVPGRVDGAVTTSRLSDFAKLRVWHDPAICEELSWYFDVAKNLYPAEFRITATVAAQLDPVVRSEDALWAELGDLTFFCAGDQSR